MDNNHIKALGWGITLCVSEIPEETKAVGIRAHSFYPVNAEQIPGKESAANESRVSVIQEGTGLKKYRNPVQEENIFKIEESRIIEDPFEWNISFRPSKESGWLQWKIAKTEQEDSPGPIPPALAVHAKVHFIVKGQCLMNNRQLTIFRTVCEEGSMTKAAEKLYMTQPAVSQTIKELEQESGVCFLERYNRKVVPTESGRLLYQYACHILGLYQDLEQHLKETEGVRTIRIGANLSVGVKMLRGFIRAFEKSIQISK